MTSFDLAEGNFADLLCNLFADFLRSFSFGTKSVCISVKLVTITGNITGREFCKKILQYWTNYVTTSQYRVAYRVVIVKCKCITTHFSLIGGGRGAGLFTIARQTFNSLPLDKYFGSGLYFRKPDSGPTKTSGSATL